MDVKRIAIVGILIAATLGAGTNPAQAILPTDPICPLGPTTDPPVCVTPPPEPDVCQELYSVQQSLEPSPGLFREGCEPILPECRQVVNQTEPVDPCEPRLDCQDLLGAYELRPDPCQDPETTCQETVGKTLVFREEACAPPTCDGVASDAGMDPIIAEAVCDTARLPVCEETPETEEIDAAPVNQSLLGEGDERGADCLPCVGAGGELESCSDLCLANEVTDCLLDPPGCENARSILGGSGQLFLNDGCVPQLPICDEFGVTNPPPNSFPVDCVPFDVPPSCGQVVGVVNDLGEHYLPTPLPCGVPLTILERPDPLGVGSYLAYGLIDALQTCTNSEGEQALFEMIQHAEGQYYTVSIWKEIGGGTLRAVWNSQLGTSVEGINSYAKHGDSIWWDNQAFEQGITGPCGEIVALIGTSPVRVKLEFGGIDYTIQTSLERMYSVTLEVRAQSEFGLSISDLGVSTRYEFGVSGTWQVTTTTSVTVHGVKKIYISDPIDSSTVGPIEEALM